MSKGFLINRRDSKIMGVAAGIADYTEIDVLVIRIALVALLLLTGPVVVLLYLLAGWLAADR